MADRFIEELPRLKNQVFDRERGGKCFKAWVISCGMNV